MNQKKLIVIIIIVIDLILLLAGCTGNPNRTGNTTTTESITTTIIDNNTLLVTTTSNKKLRLEIEGYMYFCKYTPTLSVYKNGEWRPANNQLPGKGLYYLDGVYKDYSLCDMPRCFKIWDPFEINLVDYVQGGEQEREGYAPIPKYVTKNLTGKIKFDLVYYNDSNCTISNTFSTIVDV